MASPITLTGIGPNTLPGVYGQINFAQGQLSLGGSNYSAIILANITSSGSAYAGIANNQVYGPDTQVTMQTVQDAINLFGSGSPAHLMVADFMAVNKSTPLYVLPVAAATGSAATWILTLTTSGTLTNGSISLQVGPDAPVVTTINASIPDTVTTIAANMAANINATNSLPVTATSLAGVLTLTAKVVGARGNWLRCYAKVLSGTGIVLSQTQPSFATSGVGADTVGVAAALAALAVNGQRYYYYIPEAGADTVDGYLVATFGDFVTQIQQLATPVVGLRQRLVAGSVDSIANTVQVSTAANEPRVEIVCLPTCETTPGRLAARAAAAYSLLEVAPLQASGVNFDGFGNDATSTGLFNVAAPLNGSAPSNISLQSATLTGLTPLQVVRGGKTAIVKRVTTRFFTNGSGTFDGRITDGGKVTICDQFLDDLQTQIVATFPRKLIASDPAAGGQPAPPGVCTPALVRQVVQGVIANYASRGLINGQSTLANLVVQREVSPTSRISVQVGLFVNDLLHTVVLQVNQQ